MKPADIYHSVRDFFTPVSEEQMLAQVHQKQEARRRLAEELARGGTIGQAEEEIERRLGRPLGESSGEGSKCYRGLPLKGRGKERF